MSEQITVTVHAIAEDGLPDMTDRTLVNRLAFIFDGSVVSGWPRDDEDADSDDDEQLWVADSDVGHNRPFSGVTHWIEFPEPVQYIEKPHLREQR